MHTLCLSLQNKKPYKLPKIGTEAMSVIDKPDTGPHVSSDVHVQRTHMQPDKLRRFFERADGGVTQRGTVISHAYARTCVVFHRQRADAARQAASL